MENQTKIIVALIGAIAVIGAAIIGFIATSRPTELTISATQTAEAKLTLIAPESTAGISIPIAVVGLWEGKTTGINNGDQISERVATVSIPENCQLGNACGFTSTEGACNYQMTLAEIQGNEYQFDVYAVSGADFCQGDRSEQTIKLILLNDNQLTLHYKSIQTDGTEILREGKLDKK